MTVKKFMRGAFILTVAGIVSKILSASYRIPLQNVTGDTGFYVFQQVYPFIGIIMIMSLYGFPVAISKLTIDREQTNQPLTFQSFYGPILLVLFGMVSPLFLFILLFAPSIALWTGDSHLVHSFRLLGFLLLCIPLLSLLRGVSQGLGWMDHVAYSQVIEQLIRVTLIVGAALYVVKIDASLYHIGEMGVVASIVGMLFATITLAFLLNGKCKKGQCTTRTHKRFPWRNTLYIFISLGIIQALNHLILLFMQVADVITLVPNLQTYGMTLEEAMEAKGIFDRGQPLIQFGVVFGASFALSLVPTATRTIYKQNRKQLYSILREAFMLCSYLGVGATFGLLVLLPEANVLLFKDMDGTFSIQILTFAIMLTSLSILGGTVLQIIGRNLICALWIGVAFISKIILNYTLIPYFHINGSALATVISLGLLVFLIIMSLTRTLSQLAIFKQIQYHAFLLAIGCMGVYLYSMKWIFYQVVVELTRLNALVFVPFLTITGGAIYLFFLIRYGALREKQLQQFPFSTFFIRLKERIVPVTKE